MVYNDVTAYVVSNFFNWENRTQKWYVQTESHDPSPIGPLPKTNGEY